MSANLATYITRNASPSSDIRISRVPGPTVGNGFQSSGSSACCTLSSWYPVELVPRVPPRIFWEGPKIVESRIYEIYLLRFAPSLIHSTNI